MQQIICKKSKGNFTVYREIYRFIACKQALGEEEGRGEEKERSQATKGTAFPLQGVTETVFL